MKLIFIKHMKFELDYGTCLFNKYLRDEVSWIMENVIIFWKG